MVSRLDPALAFILSKIREENKNLPEDQRMGLEAYCKKYGILAPKHWETIAKREIAFSDLPHGGAEYTGEEAEYEED